MNYIIAKIANPQYNHLEDGYVIKVKELLGYSNDLYNVKKYLSYNYLVNILNAYRLGRLDKWLNHDLLVTFDSKENKLYTLNYNDSSEIPSRIKDIISELKQEFEENLFTLDYLNMSYPNNLYLSALSKVNLVNDDLIEFIWKRCIVSKDIDKHFTLMEL